MLTSLTSFSCSITGTAHYLLGFLHILTPPGSFPCCGMGHIIQYVLLGEGTTAQTESSVFSTTTSSGPSPSTRLQEEQMDSLLYEVHVPESSIRSGLNYLISTALMLKNFPRAAHGDPRGFIYWFLRGPTGPFHISLCTF